MVQAGERTRVVINLKQAPQLTPAAHITITLDSEGLHLKADGDQATITAMRDAVG